MYKFCKENKVTEFIELINYAEQNNEKWLRTICKNDEEVKEMLEDVEISLKEPHRAF